MKISEMLQDSNTRPMDIVRHKDFARASWIARAETYLVEERDGRFSRHRHDSPLDAILRGTKQRTATVLQRAGL